MQESLYRFLLGGTLVTLFAMLADVLRPKSFAGLFGAAPSIALATLTLTIVHEGRTAAALETRSMVPGALGFLVYAAMVSWTLRRWKTSTLWTTVLLMPLWFVVSFSTAGLFSMATAR
ncbi:MAG: DUF3147 family protein [Bacillota bacterium]|nr:DUF3147 family protein [Bacillota bacterium]